MEGEFILQEMHHMLKIIPYLPQDFQNGDPEHNDQIVCFFGRQAMFNLLNCSIGAAICSHLTRDLYCRYIFVARVAVGEYHVGTSTTLSPDRKSGSLERYHSTTNSLTNPTIFVAYHDAQALPEYLVAFNVDEGPCSEPILQDSDHQQSVCELTDPTGASVKISANTTAPTLHSTQVASYSYSSTAPTAISAAQAAASAVFSSIQASMSTLQASLSSYSAAPSTTKSPFTAFSTKSSPGKGKPGKGKPGKNKKQSRKQAGQGYFVGQDGQSYCAICKCKSSPKDKSHVKGRRHQSMLRKLK